MAGAARPRRYAEALFQLARERDTLDRWGNDLNTAVSRLGSDQTLHRLGNPDLKFEQVRAALEAVLAKEVAPEVLNLLFLLVRRQQLLLLPRIAERYRELVNRERHIETAIVQSAVPLSREELDNLQVRLAERLQASSVILDQRVDPAMLGGLIIRIGDTLLDGSVDARLTTLRHLLLRER